MKKVIFLFSLCLCVGFSAMAQDVDEEYNAAYANKRGVYLLPQAGDFALGVDATPLLEFVGNIFTSAKNNAPNFNGVDQTIYGKYFLKDNRALRARLTFNLLNTTDKGVVPDDEAIADDPDSDATLVDKMKTSNTDVELGIGYEFRRGNGRVQGFCGFEAAFGFNSGDKIRYDYANPMTDLNTAPSMYNFENNSIVTNATRTTETKQGNMLSVGLGVFAGVEYFFAPQMSIGGELGLGFRFRTIGQSQSTSEKWDTPNDELFTETVKDTWSAHSMEVFSRTSGRIFLMFHF